ncbi:MAG: purine-nucleoside phosphorylase [Oscillospiraceae bacterium]|nr:purine-nucleoside phosphorylase [Oscillospiraceae bacterium]
MVPRDCEDALLFLRARLCGFTPEVLLILGSGLGSLADELAAPIDDVTSAACAADSGKSRGSDGGGRPVFVPYGEIPGWPASTAPGHAGRLVFGLLAGRRVMVMQGRLHHYEGHEMAVIARPVYLAAALGARVLCVTNAAGAVNAGWAKGDIMLISDHIRLFGDSPLRGENPPSLARFPDMSDVYTPSLRAVAREAARTLGLTLREGVYMFFPGPQYETPAEIRAARALGADAVGMSTVPEVIAARHAGLSVLGLSLLSNMAAGLQTAPLDGAEVLQAGEERGAVFSALVRRCLERLPEAPPCVAL